MFKHTRIQTRMTLVIALLSTLLVAVGISGLYGIHLGIRAHERTFANVPELLAIEHQAQGLDWARMKLDNLRAPARTPDIEASLLDVRQAIARSDAQWSHYRDALDAGPERALAQTADRTRERFENDGLRPLIASIAAHDSQRALVVSLDTVPPLHRSYRDATARLEDFQLSESSALFASAKHAENVTWRLTALIVLMGVAAAVWSAHTLRRAIAKPLNHALDLLAQIEAGDMHFPVTITRDDEFGALLRGLKSMRAALGTSVDALRASEQRYRVLTEELATQLERVRITLHSIGDGVITTDAQGRVEYLNPVAEQLTGWTGESAKGQPSNVVFHIVNQTTRAPAQNPIDICLIENRTVGLATHTVLIGRDGKEYFIEDSAAPIKNPDGRILGAVLVFHDVSEQHRLSDEMSYRATHDALTSLYNRDEFERRLEKTLMAAQSDQTAHTLMYMDLDQFKLVNDAGGHAAGDRLLKHVADVIRELLQPGDTFARLGGDEFGLIVSRRTLKKAQSLAHSICQTIDALRLQHGNQRLHSGASIGLVPLDSRWPTAAALMQAADSACYAAKEAGRNRVHTYVEADQMIEARREDMQWVRRLEQALDTDRFVLFWQHITPLNADNDGIHGEILLRMLGDGDKLILPGAFLPSAERFHIAPRIDRWVVHAVFTWMASHRAQLHDVTTIAVNLSGLSISDRHFRQYVLDLLTTMPLDHQKLCFEITETAAITNQTDAIEFLRIMRTQGVRFALDDFGSGAASFGYLKSLPVDYLKIDGQFIQRIEHDLVDQATVRCIRDIARITGKKTIAEFVETEAVETLLREIGIDYTQGYLRHRPEALEQAFGFASGLLQV
jgi:diguanylate cyclase (GGDEF)-like protein/PAS domain S-box-containing protein